MALSKKPYKGTRDFFPKQMRVRDYIFSKMRACAESFAFEAYDGPLLEEVELYKAKSGEELINDQIYSFTDRGDRFVAIRPEMTPTVARMAASVHRETPKPIRWYSIPNLMRYERPQRGRLREHWQFNADVFGAPENLGELEIISLLVHLLKSFGADSSMFSIKINDRRIVDHLFLEQLKLTEDQSYKLYKVIDRSKKVKKDVLEKDIKEILVTDDKIQLFNEYLYPSDQKAPTTSESFNKFMELANKMGLSDYLEYDPTIVRGLDYYTGIVFEVFDKHPDNLRAICGGGAYANLLQIFNEQPLAGIGFGLGDVTLTDFLNTHQLLPNLDFADNDVMVAYLDEESEITALKLSNQLRSEKLRVETSLGPLKFKKIFSTAEKKGHKFVLFLGENEIKNNIIQIKKLGTKETKEFKSNDIESIVKFIHEA
jgi:histidyl-tRNA synthetase